MRKSERKNILTRDMKYFEKDLKIKQPKLYQYWSILWDYNKYKVGQDIKIQGEEEWYGRISSIISYEVMGEVLKVWIKIQWYNNILLKASKLQNKITLPHKLYPKYSMETFFFEYFQI